MYYIIKMSCTVSCAYTILTLYNCCLKHTKDNIESCKEVNVGLKIIAEAKLRKMLKKQNQYFMQWYCTYYQNSFQASYLIFYRLKDIE
jgi:hypothetical protein